MATTTTLPPRFVTAVERISSSDESLELSDTVKLKLYGFYKAATKGSPPPLSSSSTQQRRDILKHKAWENAWNEVAGNQDVARERYCVLVDEIHTSPPPPPPPPPPTSNSLSNLTTLKRGPLWKKREKSDEWSLRYFELQGEVLFFYEGVNEELPQGFFLLSGTLIEVVKDPIVDSTTSVKKYAFNITHAKSKKKFTVACESSEDRDQWITQLQLLSSSRTTTTTVASPRASTPPTTPPQPLFRSPSGRAVDLYGVPQAFASAVDQTVNMFLSYIDSSDTSRWAFFKETRQVRLWSLRSTAMMQTSSSSSSSGGRAVVGCLAQKLFRDVSMGEVWDAVWRFGERKKYESSLDALHLVETLGPQTRVEHLCYAATWPTSRRQFTRLYHYRVLESSAGVVLAGKSVEHPIAPNYDDAVMANLIVSGFLIEPVSSTSCKVSYVIIVDPCISGVPHYVVAYTTCFQGLILDKIESHILAVRANNNNNPRRVIVVENIHHANIPAAATITTTAKPLIPSLVRKSASAPPNMASTTQFLKNVPTNTRIKPATPTVGVGGGSGSSHLFTSLWAFSQRQAPNLIPIGVLTFIFANSLYDVVAVSMLCSACLLIAFLLSPRQFVRFHGELKIPMASTASEILRGKIERALPFHGFFWLGRWWGAKRSVVSIPDTQTAALGFSFVTAHFCFGVASLEPHESWCGSAVLICVDATGHATLSIDVNACDDLGHAKATADELFQVLNSAEFDE